MPRRRHLGTIQRAATLLLVAATLFAGLLGAVPVPRARADTPVPVSGTVIATLSITEVENISVTDPGCGQPDFFAKVQMDDDPVVEGPEIGGNSHPFPTDWVFTTAIDYGETDSFPITIDLFDDDEITCLANDHADITPAGGRATLQLAVDLTKSPCAVTGDVSGPCGQPITAKGNSDGDGDAAITFVVTLPDTLPDTDGDGLPDDWERNGVAIDPDGDGGIARQQIELPRMGTQVGVPDIFIQLDWMQGLDTGTCVLVDPAAGAGNHRLDSTRMNDDMVDDPSNPTAILDGPDRTCDTDAANDDLQAAAVGSTQLPAIGRASCRARV